MTDYTCCMVQRGGAERRCWMKTDEQLKGDVNNETYWKLSTERENSVSQVCQERLTAPLWQYFK